MYDEGQGVSQDHQEAAKWFRLAADLGYVSAQFRLAVMYDQGKNITQDYQEALKYYHLAAEQGHTNAQASLGIMYGQGQGTLKNDVRAHMWLDLAASNGSGLAEHGRNLLAKKMSPSKVNEAKKLAEVCKKSNYKDCK
jgi:TPR repeat protein